MKSNVGIMVLTLCLLFGVIGCDTNSSMVEANTIVEKLPDCKEVVQSISFLEAKFMDTAIIEKYSVVPNLEIDNGTKEQYLKHVILYRTKSGGFRIALVGNFRPPVIIGLSQEFKKN
jgi:hypothetical protein